MYPEKLWDYEYIAGNPNTTREYILEHYLGVGELNREIKLGQYQITQISQNINITAEDVLKYPDLRWNPLCIIKNRNLTLDEVIMLFKSGITLLNGAHIKPVQYYSANPRLTWDDVMTRDIDEWDWYSITQHPWVTESMLEDKQYPWRVDGFARNPNLTMSMVINNGPIRWQVYDVSMNPGITWKDIVDNPEYLWDWHRVSRNPNITLEILRAHPLIKWDWEVLSYHPNITWDMIIENPDLPWNKRCVSLNPNITWDIVRDNPEWPWVWIYLSENEFTKYGRN